MSYKILTGDSLQMLRTMEDESVDCVITSPPYYGLRDYGTATWEGGDPECDHKIPAGEHDPKRAGGDAGSSHAFRFNRKTCHKCGAIRIDDQIGLEETPEAYIDRLVEVFREVRRVLKKEGTLWLNIGDSYCATKTGNTGNSSTLGGRKKGEGYKDKNQEEAAKRPSKKPQGSVKTKDLIGIPWMLAFALRADGWYLRQDIIWHKPNAMPESVKDRCTKSHEYIFLLSKSPKYYFNHVAIKEPSKDSYNGKRGSTKTRKKFQSAMRTSTEENIVYKKRNKRSVWDISTQPFKEAHFATFPEALVEPCLLAGCPEGGTALDPFSGAGTVGVVCKKQGRDYIGIELNPEYVKIQEQRIENTPEKGTDPEQVPGQMSLEDMNIAN